MSRVNMTIQLPLERVDVEEFKGSDLFIIPHLALERPGILAAMAALEGFVEKNGDGKAVAAFQTVGEFFARAMITGPRRADA